LDWLKYPSQINGDDMNNVRRETSRNVGNKMGEYLNEKMNELETNSKNKNIRDLHNSISEFRKGYQTITNLCRQKCIF